MRICIAVLDPDTLAAIEAVKRHAAAHVFDCTKLPLPPPPGDDPRHVVLIGNVRAVYSHTLARCHSREGCFHLFHQLSISLQPIRPDSYPSVLIGTEIANLFGMPEPWTACGMKPEESTVNILLEIEPKGHA